MTSSLIIDNTTMSAWGEVTWKLSRTVSTSFQILHPYRLLDTEPVSNEFLLLVKPECFRGVRLESIQKLLRGLLSKLGAFQVSIIGAAAFNAAFSRHHRVIERQYSVLNMGARRPQSALPEYILADCRRQGMVMGAYEFLEAYPDMLPWELESLAHQQGTSKFSNGVYGTRLKRDGQTLLIINAFHPEQIRLMNSDGGAFLALACRTKVAFAAVAENLVGHFMPSLARTGSLRSELLRRFPDYGIQRVDALCNGYHLSPSPLEGMFAIRRLFRTASEQPLSIASTTLGVHLAASTPVASLSRWESNPLARVGRFTIPLFELAEGRDAADFLTMVHDGHFIVE